MGCDRRVGCVSELEEKAAAAPAATTTPSSQSFSILVSTTFEARSTDGLLSQQQQQQQQQQHQQPDEADQSVVQNVMMDESPTTLLSQPSPAQPQQQPSQQRYVWTREAYEVLRQEFPLVVRAGEVYCWLNGALCAREKMVCSDCHCVADCVFRADEVQRALQWFSDKPEWRTFSRRLNSVLNTRLATARRQRPLRQT